MSPSRDVLHHRRKTNKTAEILENKEEKQEISGERNFSISHNDTFETLSTEIVNFQNENGEGSTIATVTTTARRMSWLPVRDKDLEKEVYVLKNLNKFVEGEKVNVTILGLFELTQKNEPRPEGPSELEAANLAIDKINKMGLLSKFHLKLHHNDTEVSNY